MLKLWQRYLKKQGKILLDATTFRFDGSDLMPGKIGAGAFWTGMVDYSGGKSAQDVANDIQKTGMHLNNTIIKPTQWQGIACHCSISKAEMEQLYSSFLIMALGVAGCVFYFFLGRTYCLTTLSNAQCSSDGNGAKYSSCFCGSSVAIPFGPAMFFLCLYLVYPVFESVFLSFHGRNGDEFVGLGNYTWLVNDAEFRSRCSITCCG